ncbi:Axonemal dynein light chain domain-containing protein 1, partial [Coelomomyces lativittatus]
MENLLSGSSSKNNRTSTHLSEEKMFIPPTILNDIPKLESKEYLTKKGFNKSIPKPKHEKRHIHFNTITDVENLDALTVSSNVISSTDLNKNTSEISNALPNTSSLTSPKQTNQSTLKTSSNITTAQNPSNFSLHDPYVKIHERSPSINYTPIQDKNLESKRHPSNTLHSSKNLTKDSEPSFPKEIGTYKINTLASLPPAPPPTSSKRPSFIENTSLNYGTKKEATLKTPISVFSRLKTYLDPETGKSSVYSQVYQNKEKSSGTHSSKHRPAVLFTPTTIAKEEIFGSGQPSRKHIIALREKMHTMLQKVDAIKPDHVYPSDVQNLLNLAQQENLIFDTVFQEVIRHVTMNLLERGELLMEIRQRYLNMFQQIPKIVESTYANYVAQCYINKKLRKELTRIRDELSDLTSLLVAYKDLSEKLVQDNDFKQMLEDFMKAEHVDDILNEYHMVYRWQRSRMEEHIKRVEQEKKVWVDAATCLSLRIATDHGLPDVAQLQRYEYGRIRATNHIIAILQTHYIARGHTIESEMNIWLQLLSQCAHEIQNRDKKCLKLLSRTMREMKQFQMMLEIGENELEEVFNISGTEEARKNVTVESAIQLEELSISNLHHNLKQWVDQINGVSVRFTSERDERILSDLCSLQKNIQTWLDPCFSILRKAQKTESGSVYVNLQYELSDLKCMLENWLEHLKIRITGDDGLASQIISIQNVIEDKYTFLASKLDLGAMTQEEKQNLFETVNNWSFQLNAVCSDFLNNSSAMQENRLPMQTGLWLTKLMDQLSTENELQKEDNFKLHNSVVHWVVQLLMKTGLQPPDESWDAELEKLHSN